MSGKSCAHLQAVARRWLPLLMMMGIGLFAVASAPNARAASVGKLTVKVQGLPKGTESGVRVVGPKRPGTKKRVRFAVARKRTVVLRRAPVGKYRVLAREKAISYGPKGNQREGTAIPNDRKITVRVRRGRSVRALVDYGTIKSPTKVVASSDVKDLRGDPSRPTAIVFKGKRRFAKGLFLTASAGGNLPNGLLVRVTGSQKLGSDMLVKVKRASVFDIFPNVDTTVPFPVDVEKAALDLDVECKGEAAITADTPKIFDVFLVTRWETWKPFSVDSKIPKKIELFFNYTIEQKLRFGKTINVKCSLKGIEWNKPIRVYGAPVGWAQLKAVPSVEVKAQSADELTIGAKTTTGLRAEAGSFKSWPSFEPVLDANPYKITDDFDGENLSLSANLALDGAVGLGVVDEEDVRLSLKNGVEAKYVPGEQCGVDATAGQLAASMNLVVLGEKEVNIGEPLWTKTLWTWDKCQPSSEPIYPDDPEEPIVPGALLQAYPWDPPIRDAIAVSAGDYESCAIRQSGQLRCWSNDDIRQDLAGLSDTVAVEGALWQTCAIQRGGQVWCWGTDSVGQLGYGSAVPDWTIYPPTRVPGADDAVAISSSDSGNCIVRRNGTVACWGYNEYQQLGPSDVDDVIRHPTTVPGINNAVSVETARSHSCAVLNNGHLECWGSDDYAEGLIDGGDNLTNVRDVEVSSWATTCVVKDSGLVYCWGNNDAGVLGDGTRESTFVPQLVPGLGEVKDLSIADSPKACAVRVSGQAMCWGGWSFYDEDGGLRPAPVQGASNVKAIEVGHNYSHAIRASGTVLFW